MLRRMRGVSALVLALVLLSLCACAPRVSSGAAQPAPTASPEAPAVVDAPVTATEDPNDNPFKKTVDWADLYEELMGYVGDSFVEGVDCVMMADLDADGVPELLVTEGCAEPQSYVYSILDGAAVPVGEIFGGELTLVRDKATGKEGFLTYCHAEGDGGYDWINRVDFDGGEVSETQLFCKGTWYDVGDTIVSEYALNGETVDANAYAAALTQFNDGLETLQGVAVTSLSIYPADVEKMCKAVKDTAALYTAKIAA